MNQQEVIDLLSDSEGDEDVVGRSSGGSVAAAAAKVEDTNDKVVVNPYSKKKQKITNTNNDTKQKGGRKGQLKNDNFPSKRELQKGLVFDEDVDHNLQHTKKSKSTKDYNSDSDDDNDNITSAEEYAQHQLTTRIAHNLPPILYHDSSFVAGSTTCIDGSKAKTCE